MNVPQPPSTRDLLRNARLLVEDWRASGVLRRYFIASQLASGALMGLCALASIVAAWLGHLPTYFGLLAVSAICFAHTAATWRVLKQRFGVRYEML
jgi:hypothetical protein